MNHKHEAHYCLCGELVSQCRCIDEQKPKRITRKRCFVCVSKKLMENN